MYYVSRQNYWPKGTPIVEVACGGADYANPNMLVAKYEGEGKEYSDPREAVEVAIRICKCWRRVSTPSARVGVGATGGWTLPFEGVTFKAAREWAKKAWDALEKCPMCSEPLPRKKDRWRPSDYGIDEEYCSERCAERAVEYERAIDEDPL